MWKIKQLFFPPYEDSCFLLSFPSKLPNFSCISEVSFDSKGIKFTAKFIFLLRIELLYLIAYEITKFSSKKLQNVRLSRFLGETD